MAHGSGIIMGQTGRQTMGENGKREGFGTRIGFILVSAGCAIGIGNVWKFPFVTGENGGGIFVIFYLIFLVLMGLPIMTMEFAVGRASRKSAVGGYKALEPKGSRWHLHGWVAIFGCWMLMMYYTTVSGWMLAYFWKFLTGTFEGLESSAVDGVFSSLLASPGEMMAFMVITVLAGFLVVSAGVQKGLEKVTKVMMAALLVLIVVLAIHSLTLSGAAEGVRFYLLPSLERAKSVGMGNVIVAAMNQAFFTLSLGVAAMEIFGSYMSKEYTLTGEAIRIVSLDTFVAIMSGLIIFPACFSFGVQPDSGPSLIFMTLPKIFVNMQGGRVWGTLFFLFMTFASFSTVTAVFENLIASNIDNFGWTRGKSVLFCCAMMLVLSTPCVLGYNVWSSVHIFPGKDILDSEDFIVSNILLPIGSLVYLLFCTSKWGWGAENYLRETNTGEGVKMSARIMPYLRYVLPVLILIILVSGLI